MSDIYIVSACLVGEKCRRNGTSHMIPEIKQLIENWKAIAVCPEILGGLSTPRPPCEQQGERVVSKDGQDFTEAFQKGAKKVVEIAKEKWIKHAILKSKSPSCGCGQVYDGTFSGKLVAGDGITTKMLKQNGIEVKLSDSEVLSHSF
jgi:uncharacterized protein YbbK (DUF523 family)